MLQILPKRFPQMLSFLILIINPFPVHAQKAVLVGPENNPLSVRSAIIIRTTGSTGDYFKFSLYPSVPQSFSLKDSETNELIFLFVPEKAGVYSLAFVASAKDSGKVDIKVIQLTVINADQPKPMVDKTINNQPKETDLKLLFSKAYSIDLTTTAIDPTDAAEYRKALVRLYDYASTKTVYDPKVTSSAQVFDLMRQALANAKVPPTALSNLRKAIAAYELTITPDNVLFSPNDNANRQKISQMLRNVAVALENF